jgi:ribonuclease HI
MIVAYIDGGARGNPGPAGYGVRVEDERGDLVDELRGFIGVATNNAAEYQGLLAALRYAGERGYPDVRIRSDSQLLVRQMRGEYRVKHPGLRVLHQRAQDLLRHLDRVVFEHVPRENNAEADRLVNVAIDEATGPRASRL